jgi:hypothetical protein
MIIDKVFETRNNELKTGLTAYVNAENEIYISCGVKVDSIEIDKPNFNGFTMLDIDDAKALVTELQCLIKQIENNIF